MPKHPLTVGDVTIEPEVTDGRLRSIGAVRVGSTPLRNPATRFLPWFDTFAGDVFRFFPLEGIETRGEEVVLITHPMSDPDFPFRERRDTSGDLCFRNQSWDAEPLHTELRIVLAAAHQTVDGRAFTGLKYWFEYEGGEVAIHRLLDRQTWEVGGGLDDVTLCLRNWLTPPRMKIGRDTTYSTVGLDKWVSVMPGNMWARWTLLPSFDMQYGAAGVLLGWFDEVSLIRTVIESNAGEDWLRCLDFHMFEQTTSFRTNPKTILWSPDVLDEVDALNLWTRVYDREQERSRAQLGIPDEGPPPIVFSENQWRNFRFDTTYEHVVDVAAEFGADYVFIDAVWDNGQAYREAIEAAIPEDERAGTVLAKLRWQNMCCTLDFHVSDVFGGEAGLKALCDRAAAKGLKILSWMSLHYAPHTILSEDESLGHGTFGIFAARESGRHPDSGYAAGCWTANLNAPICDLIREQILGACERTGLAGFLWDSFSNLGWWQIDYSAGTMRPQFDKHAALFAEFAKAGLYLQPEGLVTFSNANCMGLHGGDIYAGDQIGYSYNSVISLEWAGRWHECEIIKGKEPFETLFRCVAHRRVPNLTFHRVKRAKWDAARVEEVKELLRVYKQSRHLMVRRTVLKDGAGVLWESEGGEPLLFSFKEQPWEGQVVDAATGEPAGGTLAANRAYRIVKSEK